MAKGNPIPIRYSPEDRRRLEEAAALAGYKHLSTYIHDKSLDRGPYRGERDSVAAWASEQELFGRLETVERSQFAAQTLLAVLVYLVQRRATTAEVSDLVAACAKASDPVEIISALQPPLRDQLSRLLEDL